MIGYKTKLVSQKGEIASGVAKRVAQTPNHKIGRRKPRLGGVGPKRRHNKARWAAGGRGARRAHNGPANAVAWDYGPRPQPARFNGASRKSTYK